MSLLVTFLVSASIVHAGSDWCAPSSNKCGSTGSQLINLACGFCRSWTLTPSIADNTLRILGLDGGSLPGDGSSANNYMLSASLTSKFDISDGTAWSMSLIPTNIPNVRDSAFWSSRDNSTIWQYGGRTASASSILETGALPQLSASNSSWAVPVTDVNLARLDAGVNVNVPERQTAYYVGGFQDSTTTKSITDGLQHFATKFIAFNTTSAGVSTLNAPFLPIQNGAVTYLPYGKAGTLLFFGGEVPASSSVTNCTDCRVNSWDHVWIYDIASDQWHNQNTTGYAQPRSEFCTTTMFDRDSGSWQIWTMGGVDFNSKHVLSDVAVLSIPAFQWFNATSNAPARMSVACATYGSQVFVIGGRNADTSTGGTDYSDVAFVYDVNKQSTATGFDPSLTTYAAPATIRAAILISSTPATWADSTVQSLFTDSITAAAISSASASTSAVATASNISDNPASLTTGAIAGIVVSIVALSILVVIVLTVRRKNLKRQALPHDDKQQYERAELAVTTVHNRSMGVPVELPVPRITHQVSDGYGRYEMDACKIGPPVIHELS